MPRPLHSQDVGHGVSRGLVNGAVIDRTGIVFYRISWLIFDDIKSIFDDIKSIFDDIKSNEDYFQPSL